MGSLDLPVANVLVNAQASAGASGEGYIAIIAPVAALADGVPRLYASGKAALTAHDYAPGISYGALHAQRTKRPFLIVPIPIAAAGTASAVSDHGATGTSVVSITVGADGSLEDTSVILIVVVGGTLGTAGIVLRLSCDGGATFRTVRLGTASSYTVPNLGFSIDFAAGTLVAGEYYTGTTSAGTIDSAGITLARTGLAAAGYVTRSWLVDRPLTAALATNVITQAEAYASSNERFVYARADTGDLSLATWALEAAEQAAEYAALNSADGRLSLGFGRRRITCPLTGWSFRRGPAWAASLREYRRDRDVHSTTWHRKLGPLSGWAKIEKDVTADHVIADVEHDERIDGGALAGRFTCFTTLSNGTGVYLAKDLTRAADDSTLLLPSNVAVTNLVCRIVQAETERIIGGDVVLNTDGTIDSNQAVDVEEAVNGALTRALLREYVPGRGARCSAVRWTVSRDDDLRGPAAVMTGVGSLNLRGVISSVVTEVKVS